MTGQTSTQQPDLTDVTRVFGRIGLLSFGGPAAQMALMHRELVEERPWLTERQYLGALSFCMLLPGPEAMQLATYAGWRLRGMTGGLIAGGLFVLPGSVVMLALALIYGSYGNLPLVQALFLGVKAAILIVVFQALAKVAGRALGSGTAWIVAILAFLALFAFGLPFPLVIVAAAAWGVSTARGTTTDVIAPPAISAAQTARTVALGAAIWALPLILTFAFDARLLTEIGLFFSKLAVVTFGGAYAVLTYMTQQVVQDYGWLTTAQMMDGLGLAETTPGPLILVTQFVGTLAAFSEGGWVFALAGATITLWVTFVPCFIWIFAGAPYIEWITHQPRLKGALDGITAAVVGVIANLSLWFAAHVFFADVGRWQAGPVDVIFPNIATLDLTAAVLGVVAWFLLVRLRVSLPVVLAALSIGGAALLWILGSITGTFF
ncbi:chromate efflux transporter [Actibacterium sp. 188UL27-1]|uniref:chromate efflux transporter n=1 Tax=Actibacterium sp. 188UL27-1 TaxID=2786961 RepID=UPI00195ACF05|nr:chromate efflux transporter [Actibacterium sp. 188UL27-1]MBM7067887.1 chromate efflux transporter [Actibacterium sp. 188UL27-1]